MCFYINKNKIHTYVFCVKHVHSMDIKHKTHMHYLYYTSITRFPLGNGSILSVKIFDSEFSPDL